MHFSYGSRTDNFYHPVIIFSCMYLGAYLEYTLVMLQVFQHLLSFFYVIRKWFLTIYIFTGVKSKVSYLGVPMIRCCNRNCVYVFTIKNMPEIRVSLRFASGVQSFQTFKRRI